MGKKKQGTKDPARDWFILLAFTLLAFIASMIWNSWFFSHIVAEESKPQEESASVFETHDLANVRQIFHEREQESLRYQNEYQFVDPSR